MTQRKTCFQSPIGPLTLVADGDALAGVHFASHRNATALDMPLASDDPLLARARAQLAEYFAGTRERFDLSLTYHGTDFQRAVWAALATIPFATTIAYSELARRAGRSGAARAVGAANGRNPLSIVVPCHRVIGVDGALTGYAGGLATKRLLLEHEQRCARV